MCHGPGKIAYRAAVKLDVVIVGGGIAGLWLLDELVERGDRAVLVESGDLGGTQTVCSQGIIHGGLKYTLDGVLSKSAEAIREMPDLWRACLAGRRTPDLRGVRVRAEHCWLWRTESVRSRLGMIGARIGLRTAPQRVAAADRPAVLAACPGTVAKLAEPVIDPVSLLEVLATRHRDRIVKADDAGALGLDPAWWVLTAGPGNEALASGLGAAAPAQRRPLRMLLARGPLPVLNGHCVDGARTRVTITADVDAAGRVVWQVGGQIAEEGVTMDPVAFVRHGAREVAACVPGLDLAGVEWSSYAVDRAEAAAAGRRPGDATVLVHDRVITAWPTKLALAPRLAAAVRSHLGPPAPGGEPPPDLSGLARPTVARPPWERDLAWTSDV